MKPIPRASLLALATIVTGCGTDGPCDAPRLQAVSEPCCIEHGADACAPGLFCAGLEGEDAICQVEGSRADREACDADRQCASGSCNIEAGVCRAAAGTGCDRAIGCALGPDGDPQVCGIDWVCIHVGNGTVRSACDSDGQCASGQCHRALFQCRAALGEMCDWDAECEVLCCPQTDHQCVDGLRCHAGKCKQCADSTCR